VALGDLCDPTLTVTKAASPDSLPEPGGDVTFIATIKNTVAIALELTALSDDIHGDLNGQGDCAVPQSITVGDSYSCAFTVAVNGNAGESETDTITATVRDNQNNSINSTASATVTFTDADDTDGDGVPDSVEGNGDYDEDGIPNDQDYDPTGYFYDSATGEIISGGLISVTCDTGTPAFVGANDGSVGYYQYTVSGAGHPFTCTQTIATIPPGYELDSACPDLGQLDVPAGPQPHILGAGENGDTGILTSAACAGNPYHGVLVIEPDDAHVFLNNIALRRAAATAIPTLSWWALVMFISLLAGTGVIINRRRLG